MTALRFECLEAGCEVVCRGDDEDELVAVVERHMADAHDSFELEDVILANAVPDADSGS